MKTKKVLSLLLAILAFFVAFPTEGYAIAQTKTAPMDSLPGCPYVRDRSSWAISASQAAAYAQVIQNTVLRFEKEVSSYDSDDVEYDVYATMFDAGGNTLLWVCGVSIENREYEWPLDIEFGNKCFQVIFEEIWEWNGKQAVKFPIMSYDSYANLRTNGLEVYTCYGGTDVDGEAWDAFYPFINGKISTTPDWCRAWIWMYGYKLEELNIPQNESNQSKVKSYIKKLEELSRWPALPFDWSTVSIEHSFGEDDFKAQITGGSGGYQSLYPMDEYGYSWPFIGENTNILLSSADIANQDGRWGKAAKVIECLTKYSISSTGGFIDVQPNEYYAEPVKWAVKSNITTGTSSTTFSPNETCSNKQILTFIWRANGSPESNIANPFSDVKESDYYYKAALWSYEKGIVSGNTFNGDANCTRSMAVTYLWKNAGSPNTNEKMDFKDVSSNVSYAQAVSWAVKNGITSGTSATAFSPNSTCTRGQIMTFLYRSSGQTDASAS